VKLLLDTHAVLWWQTDDRRLSGPARRAIATADIVWVSAASGWEVAIKTALGRLRADEPFAITVAADDFTEPPATPGPAPGPQAPPGPHPRPFHRPPVAPAPLARLLYLPRMIWTRLH